MKKIISTTLLITSASLCAFGQNLPTIGEVYDFNIGDEFHTETTYWLGTYNTQLRIIDVEYALDNTEVTYTKALEGFIFYDGQFLSGPDTISETITNLDSSIFYLDDIIFNYDTLHFFSDSLCGAEIFGGNSVPGGKFLNHHEQEWGIGLGLTHSYHITDVINATTGTDLIYYIKDGVECGISQTLGVNDRPSNSQNISVYPSIFNDQFTVRAEQGYDFTFTVYSVYGQEILNEILSSTITQMNFDFVSPGNYIYVVRNRKNHAVIKSGHIIKAE